MTTPYRIELKEGDVVSFVSSRDPRPQYYRRRGDRFVGARGILLSETSTAPVVYADSIVILLGQGPRRDKAVTVASML